MKPIIEWCIKFLNNSPTDFELTPEKLALMEQYYIRGIDPWEAAAAIEEGRSL